MLAPKSKKNMDEEEMPLKRPRTSEDFYAFCTYVLEYANYELLMKQEELREKTLSPMGSTGSVAESVQSEPIEPNGLNPQDDGSKESEFDSDEDSYDLVTCYCAKPFAGRPMIECSKCLTWIHLSCAKIKKSNIPEVFICMKCTGQVQSAIPSTKFPSSSLRNNKSRVSVRL